MRTRIMELSTLKKHRLLAGLSQKDVATKLGVSQPTYHRWESGNTAVPPLKRKKLAKILAISVDELEGKSDPFDYLGYDRKLKDERRYFGEVAIHFAAGGAPLLLAISIAQRDLLIEQLAQGLDFPLVLSLDNRTVVIRATAISDVFFSSEAYDDFGPEHDTYEHGLGIFPDDDFWEIVEMLDVSESQDGFRKERVQEVLDSVVLSDEQLDDLVRSGQIDEMDRAKVRAEADERAQKFQAQATDLTWQLSNGKKRDAYVMDDEDVFSALSEVQTVEFDQTALLHVAAEGYHRTIFVNPLTIDYIAGPTHRFVRGMLREREKLIDEPVHRPLVAS